MPEEYIVEYQRRVAREFLMTELDLAETFCCVARTCSRQSDRQRNLVHDTPAYQAARYYLTKITLDSDPEDEIDASLERLKQALSHAGVCEHTLGQPYAFVTQQEYDAKRTRWMDSHLAVCENDFN